MCVLVAPGMGVGGGSPTQGEWRKPCRWGSELGPLWVCPVFPIADSLREHGLFSLEGFLHWLFRSRQGCKPQPSATHTHTHMDLHPYMNLHPCAASLRDFQAAAESGL